MSEYADITLLNCNRSASVEARSGNNSNPAVFTNPLQQTVRLNVGDKVSLEHSFINEVGAGNSQTIEFKGKAHGTNEIATYTDIQYKDHYYTKATTYNPNYRLGYYRTIETTEISGETAELKDNEAPLIIGYYLTSNEYPNYVQQPRSFAQSHDTRGTLPSNNTHYLHADGTTDGFNLFTINPNHIPFCDWTERVGQSVNIYKQKVDNERYTLFIKDKIIYSKDIAGAESQFPKKWHNGIFAEGKYHRIREKLDIKVNKGFNTPSAIAEQITQQLTETKTPEVFEILDGSGFIRPITKLIETRTYKPINSQNIYNFNSNGYANYRDTSLPIDNITNYNTQILTDYIATFGYIGVKRPEIFEAGRIMANAIVPNTIANHTPGGALQVPVFQDGFEGFQTIQNTDLNTTGNPNKNADAQIYTNIPYTEENLKKIRDFFDTQPLYPELWDDLANTENYKDSVRATHFDWTLTPEKSRFLHMNQWDNKLLSPTKYQNTFGDDGFVTDGLGLNSQAKSTVPVFCQYKNEMRDLFIPYKDYEKFINFEIQLMYGFCIPEEVEINDSNGVATKQVVISFNCEIPRTLYTSLNPPANSIKIEKGRRFGFDFHSTAFSTAIITPFSGYSNADIGVQVSHKTSATASSTENYQATCNFLPDTVSSAGTDITPYMTMSYVGANNPAVAFNGTSNRFEFVRLHTANNIGNKLSAGDKLGQINSLTLCPPKSFTERSITAPQINGDSGDTVYKISPRPPQFGYSPTFKPYRINNAQYRIAAYPNGATSYRNDRDGTGSPAGTKTGMNTHYFEVSNDNISPYSIFDSHGGIYIDNWGYSEDNWEDSLWDILGFDYSAVASAPTDKNVLTKRVNNDNITKLYRPTTNCEIVSTDSKVLVTSQFNANMYYTSLPYPINVINYNVTPSFGADDFRFVPNNAIGQPLGYYPEIAVKTQSISLTATDLQKSVLKPYYTIRSSILEGHTAIGGNPTGANLPIISVVDKYSAQGDYFFGNPTGLSFTITKPTILSEITTSINDPDGEYSNVDETSAVIYKVEKVKRTPTDILQDLLDSGKDQKKKN